MVVKCLAKVNTMTPARLEVGPLNWESEPLNITPREAFSLQYHVSESNNNRDLVS